MNIHTRMLYFKSQLGRNVHTRFTNKRPKRSRHLVSTRPKVSQSLGDIQVLKYFFGSRALIDAKNKNGDTPLHTAANTSNIGNLKWLIENGASIDAKNINDDTPLHIAANTSNIELLKCLIDNGAWIDAKNKNGDTPLHIAAKGSNINVLMCLIENGAVVTEKNIHGYTPIYYAAKNDRDDIVNYLTEIMKNDDGKKEKAENEVIPKEIYTNKDPCTICVNPRNGIYVFLPCGHSLLCEPCCIKIQKQFSSICPSCRNPITTYQKIFIQ